MNKTFISLNTIKTLNNSWRFSDWLKYCRNSNLPQNRQWRNLISLANGKFCTKLEDFKNSNLIRQWRVSYQIKKARNLNLFSNGESHPRSKKNCLLWNWLRNLLKLGNQKPNFQNWWRISKLFYTKNLHLFKLSKSSLNDCTNPHLSLRYIRTIVSFLIKHIQTHLILPY